MALEEEPTDPLTALGAGLAAIHEIYEQAIEVGFSQEQAMQIILAIIQAGMRNR